MDILQWFDDHHLPLFRFAYRLTGSKADAEDIVQTCFLELMRPDCGYDPSRAPVRTWLFGVVRNQSLKRLRHRGEAVHENTEENNGDRSPEEAILQDELESVVRRAVLTLPEMQREVLVLSYYEQMSLAEIAAILDIEVSAVKSRLQRARAGLRESLAGYAPKLERES